MPVFLFSTLKMTWFHSSMPTDIIKALNTSDISSICRKKQFFLPQSGGCKTILRFFSILFHQISSSPRWVPAKASHVRSQSCVGGQNNARLRGSLIETSDGNISRRLVRIKNSHRKLSGRNMLQDSGVVMCFWHHSHPHLSEIQKEHPGVFSCLQSRDWRDDMLLSVCSALWVWSVVSSLLLISLSE